MQVDTLAESRLGLITLLALALELVIPLLGGTLHVERGKGILFPLQPCGRRGRTDHIDEAKVVDSPTHHIWESGACVRLC